ncbi:MAG: iron-sulfur cluster assembly protein, partial [Janthinobacterium sp.]
MNAAAGAAALDAAQVWAWLGDVPDPEIPVISVVDLGIVRAVDVVSSEECVVTITPTYSGCPAMQVIA